MKYRCYLAGALKFTLKLNLEISARPLSSTDFGVRCKGRYNINLI